MNKQTIKDYVFNTIHNTNPLILEQLLNDYAKTIKSINIEKISDYFYGTEFTNWDYNSAYNYFKLHNSAAGGECASMRVGDLYGRNYDWTYDERVSFQVSCDNPKYHKSIGMSSGLSGLLQDNINAEAWNDLFELIPFAMADGINDAGVVCNVNVVPRGDKGITTGTNPDKESLPAVMIVRYILDHADTADHAIQLLQNKNIIMPDNLELHYMIADPNVTYVVEFIDNAMEVFETNIMTNFYLKGFTGTKSSLSPFGSGYERYQLLAAEEDNIGSEDDMADCLSTVFFTNAYKEGVEPLRYTDFVGHWSDRIITSQSEPSDVLPIIERARVLYELGKRYGLTWQTVHSCVYDIGKLTMRVIVQEDTDHTYYWSL